VLEHPAGSARPNREKGRRTFGVTLDPGNRFALVTETGWDKILTYRFDAQTGKLAPAEPASTPVKSGAGPGMVVFHPDGRFAYSLNRLDSTVTAFAFDPDTGRLNELQTLSTLPGYFDGASTAEHLEMHPSGKYLFAANDGHNSVVLFTIDPKAGMLRWIEEQGTGGAMPRHFGIDPSGGHLAIANLGANTVLPSRIDAGNGRLKPSGLFAEVASPACVKFLPPPKAGP
jgi:6-phosphogluconolactonase